MGKSIGNRIGEACWWLDRSGAPQWRAGWLRAWSHCADETGGEPVGVVEDDETMRMRTVPVERISFHVERPA